MLIFNKPLFSSHFPEGGHLTMVWLYDCSFKKILAMIHVILGVFSSSYSKALVTVHRSHLSEMNALQEDSQITSQEYNSLSFIE